MLLTAPNVVEAEAVLPREQRAGEQLDDLSVSNVIVAIAFTRKEAKGTNTQITCTEFRCATA